MIQIEDWLAYATSEEREDVQRLNAMLAADRQAMDGDLPAYGLADADCGGVRE